MSYELVVCVQNGTFDLWKIINKKLIFPASEKKKINRGQKSNYELSQAELKLYLGETELWREWLLWTPPPPVTLSTSLATAQDLSSMTSTPPTSQSYPAPGPTSSHLISPFTFHTKYVRRALRKTNCVTGAHNINSWVLKHCADQLGCMCLFQTSMSTGIVPKVWKHSTTIPKRNGPKTVQNGPHLSSDESQGENH